MSSLQASLLCFACVLLAGCGVMPIESTGAAAERGDYDACLERSAAVREHTTDALGRDAPDTRMDDPLAPGSIAANKAQAEWSNCLRSKAAR